MIGVEDSFHTYEYQNYFKILPTKIIGTQIQKNWKG